MALDPVALRERMRADLVGQGALTAEQWARAERIASAQQAFIGTTLVEMGVSPDVVLSTLARVSGLVPAPAARVAKPECPPLANITADVAFRLMAVPFALDANGIHVAFVDPCLAADAALYGFPLHLPYLALERDVRRGLTEMFGVPAAADTMYHPAVPRPVTTLAAAVTPPGAPPPSSSSPLPPGFDVGPADQLPSSALPPTMKTPIPRPRDALPETLKTPLPSSIALPPTQKTPLPSGALPTLPTPIPNELLPTMRTPTPSPLAAPGARSRTPPPGGVVEAPFAELRSGEGPSLDENGWLLKMSPPGFGSPGSAARAPGGGPPVSVDAHGAARPVDDVDARSAPPPSSVPTKRAVTMPAVGDTFAGYDLEGTLGQGGMATVFKARVRVSGQIVALKLMRPHLATEGDFLERFRREAETATTLVHENIVRTFSTGEEDGLLFMATELAPHGTLSRLLRKCGRLPALATALVARDLLAGLGHAHAHHVVHRDVKPANLLIGEGGRLKVTDFGIAKQQSDATLTQTGFLVGTPAYVSPEQAVGERVLDGRSDLFSVGIVLYELMTGRNPYYDENPAKSILGISMGSAPPIFEQDATIPAALEGVIDGLMVTNREHRIPTADDARAALAPLIRFAEERAPDAIARLLADPEGERRRLQAIHAEQEKKRATSLWRRRVPRTLGAALAFERALTLVPDDEEAKKSWGEIAAKEGLRREAPSDPKLLEALAAARDNQPGPTKRVADLAKAAGHVVLHVAWLKRYLRLKPEDSHARNQLSLIVDDDQPSDAFPLSTGIRPLVEQDTRGLIAGIKTGGWKSEGRQDPAPSPSMIASSLAAPLPRPAKAPVPKPAVVVPASALSLPMRDETSISRGIFSAPGMGLVIVLLVVGAGAFAFKELGGCIEQTRDLNAVALEKPAEGAMMGETAIEREQKLELGYAEERFKVGDRIGARFRVDKIIEIDRRTETGLRALLLRARLAEIDGDEKAAARDLRDVVAYSPMGSQLADTALERLRALEPKLAPPP